MPAFVYGLTEGTMKISKIMTRDVRVVSPDDTLQQAARLMAGLDVGALPVAENDRLIGMVTDRDIATRGVAEGKGAETSVRDVMTPRIKYCFDDQDVEEVAQNMGAIQVRRLPVVTRAKRLVGIVSLGDIATSHKDEEAGEALAEISRPGNASPKA